MSSFVAMRSGPCGGFPEAAAVGTCTCQFDLRCRGYPTPVLHALRPSEVPAFRQRTERPGKVGGDKEPGGVQLQEAEDKVKKIAELKRHRRGIESALGRLQAELGALFEDGGDETLGRAPWNLAGRLLSQRLRLRRALSYAEKHAFVFVSPELCPAVLMEALLRVREV